jgi:F-type H+-transporting ATPase subunit epsilon
VKLIVLTPEKEIYQGEVKGVKVPGTSGQFEILKGHAAIVSSLAKGPIRLTLPDGSQETHLINGGFVEVLQDEISLLVTLPKD